VVNSSCAIQAARNSQRHCVQYSISIRGFCAIFSVLEIDRVLRVEEVGVAAEGYSGRGLVILSGEEVRVAK
jgi:hypothetical protein